MKTRIYNAVEQEQDDSRKYSVVNIGNYGWNTIEYAPTYQEGLAIALKLQRRETKYGKTPYYVVFRTNSDSGKSLGDRVWDYMQENLVD